MLYRGDMPSMVSGKRLACPFPVVASFSSASTRTPRKSAAAADLLISNLRVSPSYRGASLIARMLTVGFNRVISSLYSLYLKEGR